MLRNCLKKGFRPVVVLTVAVLMCSLGGCSDSESGWLEGRAFTMNAYSNTGELTLTSHAEKIGLDGNVTTDSRYYGIGTNGSVSSGSTDSLSSVITVTLDGRELDSCGGYAHLHRRWVGAGQGFRRRRSQISGYGEDDRYRFDVAIVEPV